MTSIELATQAYAAFILIFWALHTSATFKNPFIKIPLDVAFRVVPIAVGLVFSFNVYTDILGKFQ